MKWKPLLAHVFSGERILVSQSLSGGCINYCYKIVTDKQSYFVKFNEAKRFPRMYACEAFGLEAMRSTKAVNVPNVLKQGDVEDMTFLVLEYIEPQTVPVKALQQFGHDLAKLHANTNTHFGWEHDNYIGSLQQANSWHNDWPSFYETQRVMPLCNALVEEEVFSLGDAEACKRFLEEMQPLIPQEPPSFVHGDLWSGNFLVGENHTPYFIDPACYYGHREMDIALTQLFGGFGNEFLQAYLSTNPLAEGWEQRLPYFQLYPLLVHAVLFGSGYVDTVRNLLRGRNR